MNGLQATLQARLAEGPLPAAEAMALALYHPEGYYRRAEGPWGFQGADYYTALDLGPLLGEALAARLEQAWERLGRPDPFVVLEPGAGRGWLGRDLLQAAAGGFGRALRYLHRDDNPAAAAAAREALAPWLGSGQAALVGQDQSLEPFQGAVVSNELFDALPAQPWRWDGERWRYEALEGGQPVWLPGHRLVHRPGGGRAGARGRGALVRRPAGPGGGAGREPAGRLVPGHRLRRDRGPAGGQGGRSAALPRA